MMKRWVKRGTLLFCCAMVLAIPAWAFAGPGDGKGRKKAAKTQVRKQRTTRMIFGDDEINATPDLGGGTLITGDRGLHHSSLIKVRKNFLPELIKSAEDL